MYAASRSKATPARTYTTVCSPTMTRWTAAAPQRNGQDDGRHSRPEEERHRNQAATILEGGGEVPRQHHRDAARGEQRHRASDHRSDERSAEEDAAIHGELAQDCPSPRATWRRSAQGWIARRGSSALPSFYDKGSRRSSLAAVGTLLDGLSDSQREPARRAVVRTHAAARAGIATMARPHTCIDSVERLNPPTGVRTAVA